MVDVAAGHSPARLHLQEIRFLTFGRAVPAVLFAVLGYEVLQQLIALIQHLPRPVTLLAVASGPVPKALYLGFCAVPVGIYLTRPRPRARDGRMVARAAAFAGTLMLLVIGALPAPFTWTVPADVALIATPLAIAAAALALYGLLHLRSNLSIIPEARQLVTTGPYRVIRHPLYCGEFFVAVAGVLAQPGLWAVLAIGPYLAIQMTRAHFEEQLLSRTFPRYREYARHTYRLVPLVW